MTDSFRPPAVLTLRWCPECGQLCLSMDDCHYWRAPRDLEICPGTPVVLTYRLDNNPDDTTETS